MKKIIFSAAIFLLTNFVLKAQTADISTIISENFDNTVSFEVIKISDATNANLVSKYRAKSQTVIIEKYDKKGKFVEFIDISAEVKTFAYNKDKVAFTEILKNKIEN